MTFVLDAELGALDAAETEAEDVEFVAALAPPEFCGIGITGTVNVA